MVEASFRTAAAIIVALAVVLLLAGGLFSVFSDNLGESDQKKRASESLGCVAQKAIQSGNPEVCEDPVESGEPGDGEEGSYEEVVPEQ
jgi:hypothetical protein